MPLSRHTCSLMDAGKTNARRLRLFSTPQRSSKACAFFAVWASPYIILASLRLRASHAASRHTCSLMGAGKTNARRLRLSSTPQRSSKACAFFAVWASPYQEMKNQSCLKADAFSPLHFFISWHCSVPAPIIS